MADNCPHDFLVFRVVLLLELQCFLINISRNWVSFQNIKDSVDEKKIHEKKGMAMVSCNLTEAFLFHVISTCSNILIGFYSHSVS